jgi:hypothetical protein
MRRRYRTARLAMTAAAFVAIFIAGATLATRADAQGEVVTDSIEDPGASTAEPEPPVPTQPPPPSTQTEPEKPISQAWRARPTAPRRAPDPAPEPPPPWTPQEAEAPASPAVARPDPRPMSVPSKKARRGPKDLDPEGSARAAHGTIWLHRTLPDPISPAARLDPRFAGELASAARKNRVGWALVLAVLRARGAVGAVPAGPLELQILAGRLSALGALSAPERALRLLSGSESFAEKALALARYNRAIGLRSLVTGLEQAKPRLQRLILRDPRIDVYWGGEGDIQGGRIDVRVLVLIRYLANVHGQVTVSSLHSGHGLYSRPGVISAHIYGLAVDISVLGRVSILGHQQPGGLTEHAVRSILLLPAELQPRQVISLLGLGGPSFPLGDHDDHIHVGY